VSHYGQPDNGRERRIEGDVDRAFHVLEEMKSDEKKQI